MTTRIVNWAPGDDDGMGELIVLRHGETEWSRSGRHTGRTDIPLTERGEQAPALARRAREHGPVVAVFTSPAGRAVRTAELAGLARPDAPWPVKTDPDLQAWDYGGYEG